MLTTKEQQGIHRYAAALPDIELAGGHHLRENEPTGVESPAVKIDAARVNEDTTCKQLSMLVWHPAWVLHKLGRGIKPLLQADYARLWGAA